MNTVSAQLAQHFSAFSYAKLPDASKRSLKRLLLDYLGVTIAGSQSDSGTIARTFAKLDGGKAQATIIGEGTRTTAAQAAFANGISAHSLELDDIDVLAYFHFSPPVYSAALAAGEMQAANGKQLLVALAAGCEMMERVSRASNPSLRDRNYHTTAACGVFGATIAAGLLWKIPPVKLVSAFGLAGAQASGVLEFQGTSMQKRFAPGPAARAGLTAARMAQLGYIGQEMIFEGKRGFLVAFTDKSDVAQLTANLHKPYRLDIEYKPYACARPIHNAIDCALEIRRRDKPDLAGISHIEVARHPSWVGKHGEKAPKSFHAAQLSLAFSIAVALKEGGALLAQYSARNLKAPLLVRLMGLTDITVDASLPRGVSCRMTMTMSDGRKFVSQIDYPKGSIEVPMTDEEIRTKFEGLAVPVIGAARAEQLADMAGSIEKCGDIASMMKLTAGRKSAARSRKK